jgi:hypothetical protein
VRTSLLFMLKLISGSLHSVGVVKGVGLGYWGRGFESRSRHGCLSSSVLCCPA